MQVTTLKPDWPKGYSRLGSALLGLKKHSEAEQAYQKGQPAVRPRAAVHVGMPLPLHSKPAGTR